MKRQKLGGRIAAAVLALMMTSSMTVPVFAEEMQDANALNAVVYTEETYYGASTVQSTMTKVAWETGLAAFSKYVPYASLFMPSVKALGELIGLTGSSSSSGESKEEPSISDLQIEIQETRLNLIQNMKKLNQKIDENTLQVLNKIDFGEYKAHLYDDLDSLHASVKGIARDIDGFNSNKDLSSQEKAVEIARLIKDNADWNDSSNPVFLFNKVSDTLSGASFSSDEKDVFTAYYENIVNQNPELMFSGEAYDKVDPYMERIMSEYHYAYTVLSQCLDAALTVSRFSDEEKEWCLKNVDHYDPKHIAAETSVLTEIDYMTKTFLDGEDPNSIISRYSAYKYKSKYNRTVFIYNKANQELSPVIRDSFIEKAYLETGGVIMYDPKISENALTSSNMQALYTYVKQNYKDISFLKYLEKIGFDTANFTQNGNAYFALADNPIKRDWDARIVGGMRTSFTDYAVMTTFDPRSPGGEQFDFSCFEYYVLSEWKTISSAVTIEFRFTANPLTVLTFQNGEASSLPDKPSAVDIQNLIEKEASKAANPNNGANLILTKPDDDYQPTTTQIHYLDETVDISTLLPEEALNELRRLYVESLDNQETSGTAFHAELNPFAPTVYPAASVQTTANTTASSSTSASGSTSSGNDTARNSSAVVASSPTTGDSRPSGLIAVCTASLLAALLTVGRKKHD